MKQGRRAVVYVGINNTDVTGDIRRFITSFTFEENASGQSDEISIEVHDLEKKWLNDWRTETGTKFDAKIEVADWDFEGDYRYIECGEFYQDSFLVSGYPISCTIRALSIPNTSNKNSKTWEKVKMKKVAKELADRLECELLYLCTDFNIQSISQKNETDISFLYKLCSDYGLGMKAFTNKIIIYDKLKEEEKEVVGNIDMSEMTKFNLEDSITGTYTGAKITYTDSKGDNTYIYKIGTDERLLTIDDRVSSVEEAEIKAKSRLHDENVKAITINFTISGGYYIYPSTNYNITGLGRYNGKYYIDSVKHNVCDGYTISVTAHKATEDELIAKTVYKGKAQYYWTKKGRVYHSSASCGVLKKSSEKVQTGTLAAAKKAKKKACKTCSK